MWSELSHTAFGKIYWKAYIAVNDMNDFESFLSTVAPKIGPNNAFDLGRDASIHACLELIEQLGIPKDQIQVTIGKHLRKTAQSISQMPVPSPLQMRK